MNARVTERVASVDAPAQTPEYAATAAAVLEFRQAAHVLQDPVSGAMFAALDGAALPAGCVLSGTLPPLYPEWFGGRSFVETHGTRFAYVVGEMARGIGSVPLVIAAARAGVIGFFGAGGLSLARVDAALAEIAQALAGGEPLGCNLIHSPSEPTPRRQWWICF